MTSPDPSGIADLLRQTFDRFQSGRATAQQTGFGLAAFAATAIPDAYFDVAANMDPYSAGAYSSIGAVATAFIAQRTRSALDRRRLRRNTLRDPNLMLRTLLDSGRDDLADEMIKVLQAHTVGMIHKRELGHRLQEIVAKLVDSTATTQAPELTPVGP